MSTSVHARDVTQFSSPIRPITPASSATLPRRSKSTPKLLQEQSIHPLAVYHAPESKTTRTPPSTSSSTWSISTKAPRLRVSVFASKFRLFKARRTQSARDLFPQSVDPNTSTQHDERKDSLPIRRGHPVVSPSSKNLADRRNAVDGRRTPLVGLGITGLQFFDGKYSFHKPEPISTSMAREGSSSNSSSSSSSGTGSPVTPDSNVSDRHHEEFMKRSDNNGVRNSSEMNDTDLGDATSILGVLFGGEGDANLKVWDRTSIVVSSPLAEGASPTLQPTYLPPIPNRSALRLSTNSMMRKSASVATVTRPGRTPGMSKEEEEALDEYAQYMWCVV